MRDDPSEELTLPTLDTVERQLSVPGPLLSDVFSMQDTNSESLLREDQISFS